MYGIAGARLQLESGGPASLELGLGGGRGSAGAPAGWLEGELAGDVARAWRRGAAGLHASAFGLDYSEPFRYRAAGGTVEPHAAATLGDIVVTARGDFRRGAWRTDDDTVGLAATRTGTLAVTGGSLSLARAVGPTWIEVAGEGLHGALDGWYRGGTAALTLSGARADLSLSVRAWDTPTGGEIGYGVAVQTRLPGGLWGHAQLGRTTTDPLYGTPGSFAASVGVSWRVGGSVAAPARPQPVVEVGDTAGAGRRVRFRLRAPNAQQAAVSGDFTGWQPTAMRREGAEWLAELVVAPGFHHFGFLVDGATWLVPEDAPGIEKDGWGRQNASFIVEK
ncbi:MAG TPA: glycogen-binding domain-containing protein [Longimicrobiales bacterium]|nr:glycogen-binding domain-containing protein [Longimicrobiales bacterium]